MIERIDKVKAYATAMADKYLFARQKLAIMEPLLKEDVTKLFDKSYGAHAHDALALTLILDLIRDICAFTLDTGERAASLVNIWRLITNDDLRSALRAVAAKPHVRNAIWAQDLTAEEKSAWLSEIESEDIERNGKAFDDAFARAAEGVVELANSSLADSFKTVRDKALAHYEMRPGRDGYELFDLDKAGVRWGSPREFLDRLDRVVWDVVLVATWDSYDKEGFDKAHRLYAADFWARLQGRSPVQDV
jgi:hypothetical protein